MKRAFTLVEIMIVVGIIGLLCAIAIPSFMRARAVSQQGACLNNLRQIEYGKECAAIAEHWADGQQVITTVVNTYIKGNTEPQCPAGGVYSYNPVSRNPTCSFVGSTSHRLPLAE